MAALTVAVVGVGVSFAQSDSNTPVDSFLSKVAAKLGIDESKLQTAVDEAYSETIDEQVAAGTLPQAMADRMKERGFDMMMPGIGRGHMAMRGAEAMDAAAGVLGMTTDELITELKTGKSLADVAEAKGISVDDLKAKLLEQVHTQLDSLVAEGKLTQAQADSMYTCTESRIDAIVTAQPGPCGICGGMGGRGPRSWSEPSSGLEPGSTVEPGTSF
jgi:uncharacterized protein YidB (DUF937 family)